MMKLPFTSFFNFLSNLGGKWMEKKLVEAEGAVVIETARVKAEATVLVNNATHIADWERIQAENAGSSWKDEFWTILIAIPLVLAFFPQTQPAVIAGFEALREFPEWWVWAFGLSLSASFGIRSGMLGKAGSALNAAASSLGLGGAKK